MNVSVYVCACLAPSSTKNVETFWIRGGDFMYGHQKSMDSLVMITS